MLFRSDIANSLLIQIFIVLFFALLDQSRGQECICNAKFVGEYCGSELNAKSDSGSGNCSNVLIYFCGKSNLRKGAIALKACSEKGFDCATKSNKDNPCFANLHCNCAENHRRKKKYCGSDLVGTGCKPNVVYKCPMWRGNKLNVEDGCPNGCQEGRCV